MVLFMIITRPIFLIALLSICFLFIQKKEYQVKKKHFIVPNQMTQLSKRQKSSTQNDVEKIPSSQLRLVLRTVYF